MIRNDLYRQFLMPSQDDCYNLSVCYELFRLVGNMLIMTNAFMVILLDDPQHLYAGHC